MTPAETVPLSGRTVVVTRSREQAPELVALLEKRGAEVLAFPVIAIVDPESFEPLDTALGALGDYDWVVFTSANAVDRFFARLADTSPHRSVPPSVRVAAVGTSTAARLERNGVTPDMVPADHRAEGLLEALLQRGVGGGSRVLVPRALEAREILPETLREHGAVVDVVPVYRTVPGPPEPHVLARLAAHTVDAVTFTSASTVRNFLTLLGNIGDEEPLQVMRGVVVASIGPVTSEAARKRGLTVDVEAAPYTVAGLVDALAEHVSGGGARA